MLYETVHTEHVYEMSNSERKKMQYRNKIFRFYSEKKKKKGIYRVESDLASCLRAHGYKASERVSSFVSAPGDFTAM